jgi:mannose-6-phosphate isomerase class I
MKQISVQIEDEQKAALLIELLSALDFVHRLSIGETNEVDEEAIVEDSAFYQDPRQEVMEREVATFEAKHQELVNKYLGQYVAIYQGQLIDFDTDEVGLIERINAKYPNQVVLVRKDVLNRVKLEAHKKTNRKEREKGNTRIGDGQKHHHRRKAWGKRSIKEPNSEAGSAN